MEVKVLSTGISYESIPLSDVRPESDRPRLSEVSQIPVIDLGCENRAEIIEHIRNACCTFGFFQVVNHGVSKEVYEEMLRVGEEFFKLPVEERMKLYTDDPTKTMRLSTSFNVKKEQVHNWRDYLRLHCYPLEVYSREWPDNPVSFRSVVSNYCEKIRQLGFLIEELISESLGLDITTALGEQGQHMDTNNYPTCPEPELAYGLPGHTYPNALTILLQDQLVAGLQVLVDGKWVVVNPHPDAFLINIGVHLQALSNGQYKSVWHRAIVNADKPRMSVASFPCPCNRAEVIEQIPNADENALINNPIPSDSTPVRDFQLITVHETNDDVNNAFINNPNPILDSTPPSPELEMITPTTTVGELASMTDVAAANDDEIRLLFGQPVSLAILSLCGAWVIAVATEMVTWSKHTILYTIVTVSVAVVFTSILVAMFISHTLPTAAQALQGLGIMFGVIAFYTTICLIVTYLLP